MKCKLIILLLLPIVILTFSSCTCGENQDKSSKDVKFDDDSEVVDDSVDDDAGDDSGLDDDTGDDADDDTVEECPAPAGFPVCLVDGGIPGHSDTSAAFGPDGTKYVAACKGHRLQVYVQAPGETEWTVRVVDEFAEGPALAVDEDGHLHLAYHDLWHDLPKYATDESGHWEITTIDTVAKTGKNAAIALDQDGAVHISYMAETTLDVRYTTNKSGSWSAETVWWLGSAGSCTSIAVDHSGYVYITFGNPDQFSMGWYTMLVSNRAGYWKNEFSFPGWCASVKVDEAGTVHEAYDIIGIGWANINYATDSDSGWLQENISGSFGSEPVLALDDLGNAHIAYQDPGNGGGTWLDYATNESGSWEVETIFTGTALPENQSIAWADDSLLVSSYVYEDLSLYISTKDLDKKGMRSSNSGEAQAASTWTTEQLDFGSAAGQSIAVDKNGEVHLFYSAMITATEWSVIYAHLHNGQWEKYIFNTQGPRSPSRRSLVVDDSGFAYVTFYDELAHISYYGTNDSGLWVTTPINVDGISDVQASEIAMDSDGNIHIMAYDSNTNLNHLKKISDAWVGETIGYGVEVDNAALALDPFGGIHSCYASQNDGHIHYARSVDSTWGDTIVDPETEINRGCAITTDQNGTPLISFVDKSNYHIKFAKKVQGEWSIEDFKPGAGNASYTDLHSDSNGKITIVYDSIGLWTITNGTGQWETKLIDPQPSVGLAPSIAIDNQDKKWVAYTVDLSIYYTIINP